MHFGNCNISAWLLGFKKNAMETVQLMEHACNLIVCIWSNHWLLGEGGAGWWRLDVCVCGGVSVYSYPPVQVAKGDQATPSFCHLALWASAWLPQHTRSSTLEALPTNTPRHIAFNPAQTHLMLKTIWGMPYYVTWLQTQRMEEIEPKKWKLKTTLNVLKCTARTGKKAEILTLKSALPPPYMSPAPSLSLHTLSNLPGMGLNSTVSIYLITFVFTWER